MNILTDTMPKYLEIDGARHEINTDFRYWVSFEIAIENGGEATLESLQNIFIHGIPTENVKSTLDAVQKFYVCGKVSKKEEKPTKNTKQSYSFEADGTAIFADFWKYYNIDLSQEGLHWWVFRFLLEGLPEESDFKRRAYYRTCDLKGLSKKERERIVKIRSEIEIKNKTSAKMTLEERNKQMLSYMAERRKTMTGGVNNG